MAIDRNKFVSLSYELTSGDFDGEVKERASSESPLTFVYGAGLMLPKFEEHLLGLKQGDNYKFMVKSDDAYGPIFEERIVDLPKDIFKVDGKLDETLLALGNVVPMMDASGNRLQGTVKEVRDNDVKMDFNHPMAGQDLYFKGEVLEVRQATDEEIAALLGGGGCGSGCGCGSDGGSCGTSDQGCGCSTEEAANCGCGDTQEHNHGGGGCGSGCGCN